MVKGIIYNPNVEDLAKEPEVTIVPGVTIGDGTVVGARSSVFKSLPANVVCRGNPAVVIRERVETE